MMNGLRHRPLRVKLSLFMVVLLSAGLLVSSFLATTALSDYLLEQVDQAMVAGSRPFASLVPPPGLDSAAGDPTLRPPSRFFLEVVYPDGRGATVLAVPDAPPGVFPDIPVTAELGALVGQPFTVGSVRGDTEWRVLVTAAGTEGFWVVAASPLSELQGTVRRLVLLQLIVGIVVVSIAGLVGYVVVRRSLKPLDTMARAAHEIAEGDLTTRVSQTATSTEVDQLATSFNTMVTRIESSFAAQQESEMQARHSEENMRRFVADASHELRTPLTTIRGFAELIEEGAAEDPAVAVSRIQVEATRMGGLIDDLLLLARLDQQRPLEREVLDLGDVVADAVTGARAAMPDRTIDVIIEPGSPHPMVSGEGGRLRQVVDNLLTNANRYSPPDAPIVVRISCVTGEGPSRAVLEISDEGPGLSAEDADRIFERLYRTDEARSRVRGGSGLGLAIVKSIVIAHGGTVEVRSTQGQGSTFVVRLPLIG